MDTYYPSVLTNDGNTCSQMFISRNTDYMKVHLLKSESHSGQALQDFGRQVGIPRAIKTDNAKAETGYDWTKWCRTYRVKSSTTEPHSPWQNKAERGIGDLGRMVQRNMNRFNAPLSRHGWCQQHCANICNHLASRKLNWRTPHEKLLGDTPDILKFRFHFWEPIQYWEPSKQPESRWKNGRFLGINESSGDDMTYFIETEKDPNEGRNVVLTRSNIRSRYNQNFLPSGEIGSQDELLEENNEGNNNNSITENERNNNININENNNGTRNNIHNILKNNENTIEVESNMADIEFQDDAFNIWNDEEISESDDAMTGNITVRDDIENDINVTKEVTNILNEDEDDYEFNQIINHKWEQGMLILEIELQSGKTYEVPFNVIKKDRPIKVPKYIKNKVVENRRGGKYNTWAKKILVRAQRTIRRLKRIYNISKLTRLFNQQCWR